MEEWREELYRDSLEHSYKGSSWRKHKYIAIRDGVYIYPGDNSIGVRPEGHGKNVGSGAVDVHKRGGERPEGHGKNVGTGTVSVHIRESAGTNGKVGSGSGRPKDTVTEYFESEEHRKEMAKVHRRNAVSRAKYNALVKSNKDKDWQETKRKTEKKLRRKRAIKKATDAWNKFKSITFDTGRRRTEK